MPALAPPNNQYRPCKVTASTCKCLIWLLIISLSLSVARGDASDPLKYISPLGSASTLLMLREDASRAPSTGASLGSPEAIAEYHARRGQSGPQSLARASPRLSYQDRLRARATRASTAPADPRVRHAPLPRAEVVSAAPASPASSAPRARVFLNSAPAIERTAPDFAPLANAHAISTPAFSRPALPDADSLPQRAPAVPPADAAPASEAPEARRRRPADVLIRHTADALSRAIELLGTVAFAAVGSLRSVSAGLDFCGVVFMGFVTALFGGICRDMVLGNVPPRNFSNYPCIAVALAVPVFVFVLAWRWPQIVRRRHRGAVLALNLCDALGAGSFSAGGAQAAIDEGHGDNLCFVCFIALVTCLGGGITREAISGVKSHFFYGDTYALLCLCGALAYWGLKRVHVGADAAALLVLGVCVCVRMLSLLRGWQLPIAATVAEPQPAARPRPRRVEKKPAPLPAPPAAGSLVPALLLLLAGWRQKQGPRPPTQSLHEGLPEDNKETTFCEGATPDQPPPEPAPQPAPGKHLPLLSPMVPPPMPPPPPVPASLAVALAAPATPARGARTPLPTPLQPVAEAGGPEGPAPAARVCAPG